MRVNLIVLKPLFGLFVVASCTNDLSKQAASEIADADRAMSVQAAKDGFFKTLLQWADDSVIKPEEGKYPVIGKSALEKHWLEKKDFANLSWEPFRAEASKSGDLGYTIGNWKAEYCDVWQLLHSLEETEGR